MSDKLPLQTDYAIDELLVCSLVHIQPALRYACRVHQVQISHDEFEDICQEVIILLIEDNYHRLRAFDPQQSSVRTWIYAVVKNHVSRKLSGKNGVISLEDIASDSLICPPGQEKASLYIERRGLIQEALTKLPGRSQELFRLSCEGLSDVEISGLTGIKVEAVRRRHFPLRCLYLVRGFFEEGILRVRAKHASASVFYTFANGSDAGASIHDPQLNFNQTFV